VAQDPAPALTRLRIPHVAPAIYGLVVSSASMASADPGGPAWKVVVAVLVTVLVYWVAEQYAAVLADRMEGRSTSVRHVAASLRHGWPMVQASYAPLVVLVGARLLGATTQTAVLVALVFTTALLAFFGWLAGRRSGMTGLGLVSAALLSGSLGLVMIALKLTLHH
jgi:hypothetical protein